MSTDTTRILATVSMIALEAFSNAELAAFNNGVQTFGEVPPGNLAHKRAVEAKLIKPDGSTWDLDAIRDASAAEVSRRVEAGTFD